MNVADIVCVGLAGSLGAAARFVADGAIRDRTTGSFPVGTLAINVAGSLLLGMLTGLVVFHHVTSVLTVVAGTGFCGGFTTFSTASFETVRLAQQGQIGAATANLGMTVGGTLAAAAAGLALASL